LGSLTFLQSDYQPTAYLEDFEFLPFTLMSFLSGLAGGGIGYLIEKSSQKGQVEFSFSDNSAELSNDIIRFKEFILGTKQEKKIHLSVHLTQVATRYSELYDAQDGYYHEVTSFNLLRSIYLTKSISNNINIGVAVDWLGEPSIYYYDYYNNNSIGIKQTFEGIGYYAIGSYEPLVKTIDESFSFTIGLGFGVANIHFEYNVDKEIYYNYEYNIENIDNKEIKGIFFSSIVYSNLDYYLHNGLSFGLTADYVYLPKKMPAIPELNLKSRQLGNFSIGFNFSIHL
jgi:hypothetical protein